jgi:membrane protease YdiL (CAAX protease family)
VPDPGVGGAGLLATYMAAQAAGLVLGLAAGPFLAHLPPAQARQTLLRLAYLTSPALLFAAGLVALALGRRLRWRALAPWPGWRGLALGAAAGLAGKVLGDLVVLVEVRAGARVATNNPLALYPKAFAGWPLQLALVASVAVVAPLGEELFFRGLLFGWLRRRLPTTAAVAVASALFGLAHLDPVGRRALAASWPLVLPLGAVGAVLTLLYEATGSLLVPAAAHAVLNLSSLLLALRAR